MTFDSNQQREEKNTQQQQTHWKSSNDFDKRGKWPSIMPQNWVTYTRFHTALQLNMKIKRFLLLSASLFYFSVLFWYFPLHLPLHIFARLPKSCRNLMESNMLSNENENEIVKRVWVWERERGRKSEERSWIWLHHSLHGQWHSIWITYIHIEIWSNIWNLFACYTFLSTCPSQLTPFPLCVFIFLLVLERCTQNTKAEHSKNVWWLLMSG